MSELKTSKDLTSFARSKGISEAVCASSQSLCISGRLIKVEEKEVLLKHLEKPILLGSVDGMIEYAHLNEIKVKVCQQKKDEITKLLNKYQLINVVENNVYAVVAVGMLPNELKTVLDLKSYARERGLPISN